MASPAVTIILVVRGLFMVNEREKHAWGQGSDVPTAPYPVVESKEEVRNGHEANREGTGSGTKEIRQGNQVTIWRDILPGAS